MNEYFLVVQKDRIQNDSLVKFFLNQEDAEKEARHRNNGFDYGYEVIRVQQLPIYK